MNDSNQDAKPQTPPAGLEPATGGLENRCSIHLSYEGRRNCGRSDSTGRSAKRTFDGAVGRGAPDPIDELRETPSLGFRVPCTSAERLKTDNAKGRMVRDDNSIRTICGLRLQLAAFSSDCPPRLAFRSNSGAIEGGRGRFQVPRQASRADPGFAAERLSARHFAARRFEFRLAFDFSMLKFAGRCRRNSTEPRRGNPATRKSRRLNRRAASRLDFPIARDFARSRVR
jgi:hypothetical protein